MEILSLFLEKQLNKKINIFEYNNQSLNENHHLIDFNNCKYVIEILNNSLPSNINGYCYLFYQSDLDFSSLERILYNLYEDICIFKYDSYLLLATNTQLDIDFNTIDIIETESYRNTHIINIGFTSNLEYLDFKLNMVNELVPFISKDNSINKYTTLNDLIIYKLINLSNSDSSFFKLINLDSFKNIDENLLITGLNFIENGLNISKTSNSLFLHRNTLIYRLEKIKEILNLDLKNFKDSFIFYISAKSFLYFNK